MALGKPSKKTQKPASEPKTKAVSTGTKAKASQLSSAATAGAGVEAIPLRTRKKSSAVVTVDSAVTNVVTAMDPISPKAMAAAVGSSALDASSLPATAVSAASLETVPAETSNTVSAGHSASSSNGRTHAASRDAIAELAYSYWAERGYAHGDADEDWARAEAELNERS